MRAIKRRGQATSDHSLHLQLPQNIEESQAEVARLDRETVRRRGMARSPEQTMRGFSTNMQWMARAALVGVIASSLSCTSDTEQLPKAVVLYDVTVIDGTGTPPAPHQVVVLRGQQITQVGPVGGLEIPADSEVLDLDGKYLIPGFVDLHVHFPEDGSVHQAMLDRLLEYGVTTILNPGARPGAGVELRDHIRSGEHHGPRMFTAGPIIDHKPTEEGLAGWSTEVKTALEIRQAVRSQAAQGVDFVKLYRRLPPDLVAAAIDEAREHDLPVIGHMGATTWGEAASMGIDMLVHSGWGTPMDEIVNLENSDSATDTEWYHGYADAANGDRFATLAQVLVNEQVVVVPTLSITQASGLGVDASLLPQFQVELAPDANVADWWSEGWRERHPQYLPDSEEEAAMMATVYFPGALKIVQAYYQRGVRLGVGTDVGNSWMTPGVVYHHELELYQEAGIPPLEILTMATHNGAEALGILSSTGTIEAGKQADMLLLGADPSSDISNTRSIERVYLAGREVEAR